MLFDISFGFYQDNGNGDGAFWNGPAENELPYCKLMKKDEIINLFNNELTTSGTFTTTEGWVVDARRHDLDNLTNLHKFLANSNATQASVRIHDNSMVTMSLTRLEQLCFELTGFGLSLYQKKWQKLSEVESATDVLSVKSIVW